MDISHSSHSEKENNEKKNNVTEPRGTHYRQQEVKKNGPEGFLKSAAFQISHLKDVQEDRHCRHNETHPSGRLGGPRLVFP